MANGGGVGVLELLTLDQRADGWHVVVDEDIRLYHNNQLKSRFNFDALQCPDCLRHLISVEIERQMGIVG